MNNKNKKKKIMKWKLKDLKNHQKLILNKPNLNFAIL